jgi:heat shock protein HslJ
MFQKLNITKLLLALIIIVSAIFAIIEFNKQQSAPIITGIEWQWTALKETLPAAQSLVPNPESFTITFTEDATFSLNADCNVGGGTYISTGASLFISDGPLTMAYCGEQSLDSLFLSSLAQVDSFTIENGELTMYLADDAGSMIFIGE